MPTPPKSPLHDVNQVFDLLGRPAGWMLYWGNTLIVALVLLLLGLAIFIRYPDKVVTEVQVSTPTPPLALVARTDATIAQVLVADAAHVKAGQVLLVLDNPANFEDVMQLDFLLQRLTAVAAPSDVGAIELPEQLSLGLLGRDYAQLLNHAAALRYWLQRSNSGQRAQRLSEQLRQSQALQSNLDTQLLIQQQELAIAERNVQQFRKLAANGSASQLELDLAETRYLQTLRQVQEQENRQWQNQQQSEVLAERKLALNEQWSDEVMEQWLSFKATERQLRQGLLEWESQFLLRAPADGQATWYQVLSPGLFVRRNQLLLGVVPPNATNTYVAEGILANNNSGRISVGDEAYLQLDAYPYREFGQVAARVLQIAPAPAADAVGYRILLELPNGLQSTYHTPLPFRQQMRGKAFILGEKRSLLARLLDRLRSATKNT